jgi:hypothetical protein
MSRSLTFAVFLFGACLPNLCQAADVVLRIDQVSSQESVDRNPAPQLLEILVRPGLPFYGRMRSGNMTTTVRGVCRPAVKPAEFDVELRADTRIATGKFIPTENGNGKEILDRTMLNTLVRVPAGKELVIGGFQRTQEEKRSDGTTRTHRSELTMKLSVVERDLEQDDGL